MRADRVVSMMLLLERRGRMTARELADALEVSRRTVMRDIEALGAAGVPVFATRGPRGGFEIWEGFRSRLQTVTSDEAAALSLLGMPAVAAQLGLADAHKRVFLKLVNTLPPASSNEAELMTATFHHDPTDWGSPPPTRAVQFLSVAVRRRRRIRTDASGHTGQLTLDPLGLVLKTGSWFLVASGQTGELDIFNVSGLHGYETTGARFARPEDFDLRTVWQEYVESGGTQDVVG